MSFANTSDQPKDVTFQAVGSGGTMLPQQSLTLGGHVTQMLDLDALLVGLPTQEAAAGGLRIQFIGKMGDVIVTGWLKNEREGFSANIPFLMHDTGNNGPIAITYASVGMLVGQPNPAAGFPAGTKFAAYAVLRNTASVALQVSPSLYYMAGGEPGALVLPAQNLEPFQAKQIPLEAVLASGGLAAYKGDVTLTLSFTGQPGDLVVATGSVDQTGTYVFEVHPQGIGKTLAKDSPFWSVANGSDSMFTLWNPGTTPEDILATFTYTGGSGHYVLPIHLVPKASQTIDVAQLIALHQPDGEGNIIPANVQGGSVRFSGTNGPTQPINLVVSGGIFNVQTATCGTTCFCCFGVVLFDISPNPIICPFATTGKATATETMTDGSKRDVSTQASWRSTNTSVATVDSTGLVYGAGAGSANIHAEINDIVSGNFCDTVFICPLLLFAATVPEETTTLSAFNITVTSTPVTGETNTVVSGQSAQVQVKAIDNFGNVFTGYLGTVHFSSTDTLATLPADYTFTSSDAGSHTFSVTLKSVSGTSPTRDLTVKDNATGISFTQNINVWFQVTMDVERWKNCNFTGCTFGSNNCPLPNGSYFCATSYLPCQTGQPSGYSSPTAFLAVTQSSRSTLFNTTVSVRVGASKAVTFIGDAGPTLGNPYWNTGAPPAIGGCLSDQLATNLGVSNGCTSGGTPFGQATVLWRFGN